MMNKHILAMAACLAVVATPVLATDFKVEEATIPELEQAFRDHRLSCHQLVQTYLDRIAAYDKQGPKLNAILTLMYGPAVRCKRFVDLVVSGLASMYPVSSWSRFAPDHHGYQRACDLINGQASTGHLGHQCSHAPGRPILHLYLSSRRPRLETADRLRHRLLLISRSSFV